MSTVGIDVKVGYKDLREASKSAADLKKNLKDLSSSQHKINFYEQKAGISDEAFGQRSTAAGSVEQQNRILSQSLREFVNESRKSTWRERYRIVPPDERTPPMPPEGGGGGVGGGMFGRGLRYAGRMAGYAAAIGGGFSLLSFLHDSVNQAASYGAGEADLLMRGGNDQFRYNSARWGYTPEESLAIQNSIGSRTGFQGKDLNDASYSAAWAGRRMGISGQSVAEYIGGTFAATGANPETYTKQLKYLRDTAVALGARGRIEEVLHNNQQIMASVVQGRGGKELSDSERTGLLAMQMALWGTSGQAGKGMSGVQTLSSIDQSIRAGGKNPGEQIFIAQALGANNIHTRKDLWEFKKRMEAGGTAENINAVLDYADRVATQMNMAPEDVLYSQMGNIKEVFNLKTEQVEKLLDPNFRKRLRLAATQNPKAAVDDILKTPEGKRLLKQADIDPLSLEGNQHRQTIANYTNTQIEVGKKVLPWVDKLKDAVSRSVDAANKGNYLDAAKEALSDNPLGVLMLTSMGLSLPSKVTDKLPVPVPLPGNKGKGIPLVPSPTATGVLAGLNELRPKEANPSSYNEIDNMIGQGKPYQEIMDKARTLDAVPEKQGGILGLTEAIWSLVTELRVWLHKVNNDPIYNPNSTRYRLSE